jgi:hypothetical protein
MFTGSFQTPADPDIGPGILTGTVTNLVVRDTTESFPPGEKTSLLEPDDSFSVEIDWQLAGPLVWVVGGYWVLGLFIDDIDGVGQTSGPLSPPVIIPVPPAGILGHRPGPTPQRSRPAGRLPGQRDHPGRPARDHSA